MLQDDDGWLFTNDLPAMDASLEDVVAAHAASRAAGSAGGGPAPAESFSSAASFKILVGKRC